MNIVYGLRNIRKFKKPVVAIGVFDGVHRGHMTILKAAIDKAHSIGGTAVVLTFWPHPQRQELLYSLEHRLKLIKRIGIDVCIVVSFNEKFAKLRARDFVKILVEKIRPHYIYVGRNFRFGRNAEGDFKFLNKLSKIYNFKLKGFKVAALHGKVISSTYIRNLIKRGKLEAAQGLLLRPVSVLGTVKKGDLLARRLGFPTANIDPHHEVIPPSGVYAVKIILRGEEFNGVCNIGTKPTFRTCATFSGQDRRHIEVYIFGFSKNIYGEYLQIQFIKKLRNEKKFASPGDLVGQIKKDILTAQEISSLH